jgi:hypothetical protein
MLTTVRNTAKRCSGHKRLTGFRLRQGFSGQVCRALVIFRGFWVLRVEPERNTDWHIGGKQKFVAELVNIYFKAT